MKKQWLMLWASLFLALFVHASEFSKAASKEPQLIQKGDEKLYCPVCGMHLGQYYKTSHGVEQSDGITKQYCSLRCLAHDWPSVEGKVTRLLVTDVSSETLIDAHKAFYVIGSKIPGTMSMVSKLAFLKEADAQAFIKENGGELVTFEKAFVQAKEALENDVAMFVKKKQKGMYPMGEKIYTKACPKDQIHVHAFNTISALKQHFKKTKLCGDLDEKELQALSLYLWEVLGPNEQHNHEKAIVVGEKEKCPVCGMFVYKYPRWAARLAYQDGDKKIDFAFDGVKDLLKFYHSPSKWGSHGSVKGGNFSVKVTDYYTQEAIDGKKAFYVIGSDTYGPMGKEFIPFGTLLSAQTFLKDHKGVKILEFNAIEEALVYEQDK